MKVSLVVASGSHAGRAIPLTGPQFLIGRDPQCQLRPASQAISKLHCAVVIRDGKVYLKDYGSTNGTTVNDALVQDTEVVIEDGAFIGARAEVAEGVRVGEGAVLSMGVYLGASTKIIDRATGEVHRGFVPPYSVVVPGTIGGGNGTPALYCAVIVKQVDAQTRSKTSINELLRD